MQPAGPEPSMASLVCLVSLAMVAHDFIPRPNALPGEAKALPTTVTARQETYNSEVMRAASALKFALSTLILAPVAAVRSDLYWCEKDQFTSSLVQEVIEGAECRLIQKDPEPEEKEAATPAPDRQPTNSESQEAAADFPRVSPEEQANRDATREGLLRYELQAEAELLADMRDTLEQIKDARDVGVNVKEYYLRRYKRHAQNIKALRQELARLQ